MELAGNPCLIAYGHHWRRLTDVCYADSLVFPKDNSFNKLFSTEIMPSQARRLIEALFDYGLSRYPGVIKSWCKKRCLSQHAIPKHSMKSNIATAALR
jgi:hypothetical protein